MTSDEFVQMKQQEARDSLLLNIFRNMQQQGYSENEISSIIGGNVMLNQLKWRVRHDNSCRLSEKSPLLREDVFYSVLCDYPSITQHLIEELFQVSICHVYRIGKESFSESNKILEAVRADVEFEGDCTIYPVVLALLKDRTTYNLLSRQYQAALDISLLADWASWFDMPLRRFIFLCDFVPQYEKVAVSYEQDYSDVSPSTVNSGHCSVYLNPHFSTRNTTEDVAAMLQYIKQGKGGDWVYNSFATELNDKVNTVLSTLGYKSLLS